MKRNTLIRGVLISIVLLMITTPLTGAASNTNSTNNSTSIINETLSNSAIGADVSEIKNMSENHNLPFSYTNSTQVLRDLAEQALINITDNSTFLSYLGDYMNAEIQTTTGMTYNYSTQNYGVYLILQVPRNQYVLTLTFSYASNNNTIYGPTSQELPVIYYFTNSYSHNWGGYEFYEPVSGNPSTNYLITYSDSALNVSNIVLPSNPNYGTNVGTAGWIGLTPYEGATGPNNQTYILQTGFSRPIWAVYGLNGWYYKYGNYALWYQSWDGGTSPLNSGNYPNITTVNPDWNCAFSISNDINTSTVTYGVLVENISEGSVVSKSTGGIETYYSDYIVEAPLLAGEQSQIAKFYYTTGNPSVVFLNPGISGQQDTTLSSLFSSGTYVKDWMNQTTGQDINVNLGYSYAQGWWQPIMTWSNSNSAF